IGPHRINVKLARRAAVLGVPSLRFDLSGRGDSGPGSRHLGYKEQTIQDIRDAVATLAREEGTTHVMVFGICSGADDGFASALVEDSIASVVMFDPYVFPTWRWRLRGLRSKL